MQLEAIKKSLAFLPTIIFCDPGGIRTHDPQLRRLLLYPAELLDPKNLLQKVMQRYGYFLNYANFWSINFLIYLELVVFFRRW